MLALVDLDEQSGEALGLGATSLRLRRAWPRAADHLLLEYLLPDGTLVAGQWMGDAASLARLNAETAAAVPGFNIAALTIAGQRVLLQPHGVDRRMPALARYLESMQREGRGVQLISHRPERRAVVRLSDGTQNSFTKFLRSAQHVNDAATCGDLVWNMAGRQFAVPRPLSVCASDGWVAWSAVPGISWRQAIVDGSPTEVSRDVARALRSLHAAPAPTWAPMHDATAEARVLRRWVGHASSFQVVDEDQTRGFDGILSQLTASPGPLGLIHRDLHDRQILIGPAGDVGFIDFDTLSIGEAALDLGNVLAHLDFAADRGLAPADAIAQHAAAFLDAYSPSIDLLPRINAYRAATRLRMHCLHAFRPDAAASNQPQLGTLVQA